MSTSTESSSLFWDRLLAAADMIQATDATDNDVIGCLLAIDEGFSDQFDPADHYSEYVAVMICRAMRNRIDPDFPAAQKPACVPDVPVQLQAD